MTVKWSAFPSGTAIADADIPVGLQSAANVQWTWSQVLTYTLAGSGTLTNKTFDSAGTGNTFKINGVTISANTGTGSNVLATSPTLVTPVLGAATATTVNLVTITQPATAATLTIANNKTLTANNSLTLSGTDNTTMTFPTVSGNVAVFGQSVAFSLQQAMAFQ